MSQLEILLKKQMGYTEDASVRCPNCTNCDDGVKSPVNSTVWDYTCLANKANPMPVDMVGRCDLFSAKRPRRAAKDAPVIDDDANNQGVDDPSAVTNFANEVENQNDDPDFREVGE